MGIEPRQQSAVRETLDADSQRADAEHPANTDQPSSSARKHETPAGATHESPPQLSSEEVFDLLVEAVEALESRKRKPVAAGVSARMAARGSGFSLAKTAFTTFRELLNAAQDAGRVKVSQSTTHPDVFVSVVRGTEASGARGAAAEIEHLNNDLWLGMVDWNAGASYAFDRSTRRTARIDGSFASPSQVLVAPITKDEQVEWMREFTAQQPSVDDRVALEAGLSRNDPASGFFSAARKVGADRRWKRFLQERVLDRAAEWATANGVPLSDIERVAAKPALSAERTTKGSDQAGEEDLRGTILRVLASMPTHELLRLSIPVEYALRR